MVEIPAKTVWIDRRIADHPECRRRLERVLPHVRCQDIRYCDGDPGEEFFSVSRRRHGKDDFSDDAVLAFTTYDSGRRGFYFHWRDEAAAHGGACQPAMELNIVEGCVFRCAYCGFGRRVHFTLDVERLIGELEAVFAKHPEQRLYKFSNMTDLPAFEPEIDIIPPMVRRFAQETDRYLMLFTKSDNVAFLRELDHRGHTIISWSLTADSPSRLLDKRTATMDERIAAMAEMQKAGYIVRARLSPIIPVRNWEKEYRDLLERMFAHAQPDLVTLELLGWMKFDDLLAVIPPELLDGQMCEEARAAAESLKDVMWAPFTQAAHEKVYRFCIDTVRELSPRTPVSVCHGTAATWKALGELTGMTPGEYICNCGPLSAPGGALYDELHALHDGEGQ